MSWQDCKDSGPWDFTEQPDKFGYLNNERWSAQQDAQEFCEKVGLSLDPSDQHLPCGHWHKKPVGEEITPPIEEREREGKFYCAYPSTGPVYYPANYSICEIDVDLMQVTKIVELPTLPTGYALMPNEAMCKSNLHLYTMCKDPGPGNPPPYLATIEIGGSDLTLIDYFQMPNTSEAGATITLNGSSSDIGVSMVEGNLILTCPGTGNDFLQYIVYRKYSLGTNGIPVQVDEVIYADVDYKEGYNVSFLIAGKTRAFATSNTEYGRLVRLIETSFARDAFFDINDGSDVHRIDLCYGLCYDVDNGKIYMGINYSTVGDCERRIVKIDAPSMSIDDILVLVTGVDCSYFNIQALCDHPVNGFIYVSIQDNRSPHPSTLYEIRVSDFTVTRSVAYRGGTTQCNGLYLDSERGYIYYCGNGSPVADETEHKFFRFNLTTFSDDLITHVDVSDPALHWGIQKAQAYCAEVNPLLPGGQVSLVSIVDDEPQIWSMPE